MSTTLFPSDTLFAQRMLKAEGLYTGALDGIWGPLTEQAALAFEQKSLDLKKQYGSFDARTEKNINTLSLRSQKEARQFMTRVQQHFSSSKPPAPTLKQPASSSRQTPGFTTSTTSPKNNIAGSWSSGQSMQDPDTPITVKIISGTRSYAEQNKLFRQGRYHNPGPIITHARGGSSAHNFGIAWDIGIFSKSRGYIPDGPLYDEAARAGLADTLDWGGNWTSFPDKPHFQLKLDEPIHVVRKNFESGEVSTRTA